MKRLFAILCAVLLLGTMTFVTFAEETTEQTSDGESSSEDATEQPSMDDTSSEENTEQPSVDDTTSNEVTEKPITDIIVEYVQSHIEEISVIATLLLTIFYEVRKHGKLNGSIGTLNNNAVTIAQNSETAIHAALVTISEYKGELQTLLADIRKNADEKKSLEETLVEVGTYLKTAKLTTLELANEVAELLVLANIPNSVKDELYARHSKAVQAIKAMEEVMSDDGKEA